MVDPDRIAERRAPEGAVCYLHPERAALANCPICGRGACLVCWHERFDRCETCLRRDPSAAGPPVPWENPAGGIALRRAVDTLVTAFQPAATAPAFAKHGLAPAVRFALATALPLTLLRGIIPYTHTLLFGDGTVELLGAPTAAAVALDVARAMGLSLLVTLGAWVALSLPYVTLSKAYGGPFGRTATLRVMLYRAWLLPLSSQWVAVPGLLLSLAGWGLPAEPSEAALLVAGLLDLLPLVLLLFAMRATARFAAGTGVIASFLVTIVPFVLLFLAEGVLVELIRPWLPAGAG
ncbi:MAG: hypothetical protein ACOCV4_01840 [Myxococcota bacterium]